MLYYYDGGNGFGNRRVGDYSEFDYHGRLRMYGNATQFVDVMMPLNQAKRGSTLKPDFDETNVGYLFPQNDPSEKLFGDYQFNHNYKEGSNLHPHIHWKQAQAAVPIWKIDYQWFNMGEPYPTSFTTIADTNELFTYSSGTISQISYFNPIDGTGKLISSILKIKLYRDDNVVSGDVMADSFDFHIQINSAGSNQEWEKDD